MLYPLVQQRYAVGHAEWEKKNKVIVEQMAIIKAQRDKEREEARVASEKIRAAQSAEATRLAKLAREEAERIEAARIAWEKEQEEAAEAARIAEQEAADKKAREIQEDILFQAQLERLDHAEQVVLIEKRDAKRKAEQDEIDAIAKAKADAIQAAKDAAAAIAAEEENARLIAEEEAATEARLLSERLAAEQAALEAERKRAEREVERQRKAALFSNKPKVKVVKEKICRGCKAIEDEGKFDRPCDSCFELALWDWQNGPLIQAILKKM